jgi:gas vesicle protein
MRFLLGILLGIALGIAIGLIVAPQPGSETRRALQERMQKAQDEPEEPA